MPSSGTASRRAPTGGAAELISAAGSHGAPVLSVDVPSGINSTTGHVHEPAVRASATLTLALPKTGFRGAAAKDSIGELYLADIGVPPELYLRLGIGMPREQIFAQGDVISLS